VFKALTKAEKKKLSDDFKLQLHNQ
jgi:hypothetical protein